MNNKTYINGQEKKILRKLIEKEFKLIKKLIDIDIMLYGPYRSPGFTGLIKRTEVLNEVYNKIK